MSDPSYDRCALCGGTREEHNELTKHVFTTTPGDLRTKPALTERQPMKQPEASIDVTARLIEILTDNGVITPQEALLCFGIQVAVPKESPDARDSSPE